MYDDFLAERIMKLRNIKGVSARDMSLSIGQSADYINKIENKRILPSMPAFFNICEYLEIAPSDFFNGNKDNPKCINDIIGNLNRLGDDNLRLIFELTEKLK